jgi:type IV pili sensor histidine kinase/response regulator
MRLLSAIVRVEFPGSVTRVGQAVEHLLQPSGYRLSPQHVAEPTRQSLLNLPLPEPHRMLGPMPLKTALETLAGPAFRLVEDPVHRLVSFERCAPAQYEGPASSGTEVR